MNHEKNLSQKKSDMEVKCKPEMDVSVAGAKSEKQKTREKWSLKRKQKTPQFIKEISKSYLSSIC